MLRLLLRGPSVQVSLMVILTFAHLLSQLLQEAVTPPTTPFTVIQPL